MSQDPRETRNARPWPRALGRARWERVSVVATGAGLFMLMQPFAIELYTWSLAVILAGTVGFIISSHFPES